MKQRKELERDLDKIDYFFNQRMVDLAIAHFREPKIVVELAQRYTSQFRLLTQSLKGATKFAQADSRYREAVSSSSSRDGFLLCLGTELASPQVNQLQARLQFKGIKNPAYLSVRNELLTAQADYQLSFREFKLLFPQA